MLHRDTKASVLKQGSTTMVPGLVDQNVSNALKVLRTQINKTRSKLPDALTNEFDRGVVVRLKEIQQGVSNHILAEYKRAMIANRLLELSEHVLTLPFRQIPADSQARKEAREAYAAALERFETSAPVKTLYLDEVSMGIVRKALRPVLTSVQEDLFAPGYGRPLSQMEKAELNRIVDGVLESAAALSRTSPQGLRDVANLAKKGTRAVLDFLREREAGSRSNPELIGALSKWRRENAPLAKAIDQNVETASQAEIIAVIERTHEQGQRDMRENDPNRIAAETQLKEEMQNGLPLW